MILTNNLVFGQYVRIFHDQMATTAAIDRLIQQSAKGQEKGNGNKVSAQMVPIEFVAKDGNRIPTTFQTG